MIRLRTSSSESFPFDTRAFVTTIAWLRPCNALGQALTVVVAVVWLRITVPIPPLAAGIGVLALATPVAFWRLRQHWAVGEAEAFCHVAFDILLLGWALYFTGGASNPFITLLLVPAALAAAAPSAKVTISVTALAAAVYGVLIFLYIPLPGMPMHGDGFRLHLAGMTINFMIAVLLLAVFVGRMSASLNAQREATRQLRERAVRDEGILAIATQAAMAAHRLNTPLSTLRILLPELGRGREDDGALCADLDVMTGEVERCRDILREMVEYGRDQLAGTLQSTTLGAYVDGCAERFRVLRPAAEVTAHVTLTLRTKPIEVPPGLAHALLSLMQNALDASRRHGSNAVILAADADGKQVEFLIGDHGDGFPEDRASGLSAPSNKPDGLGIGLALARATVERMHGQLHTFNGVDGTRVRVSLPLAGGA